MLYVAAKRVNYLLVKFLLCLSNIEDAETNSQGVPDFCHRFSNCNEMRNDVQLVRPLCQIFCCEHLPISYLSMLQIISDSCD